MKRFIAICFSFLSLVCWAQTEDIKLYAYRQTSLPGLPPSTDSNKTINISAEKKGPSVTYLIYLTHSTEKEIDLLEIWLNGESFGVAQEPVATTPVEYLYDNNSLQPQKMLLVPATQNKVLRLTPIEKIPSKTSLQKKALARTNELIVVYKERDKVNSKLLKKIKNLPPAFRQ